MGVNLTTMICSYGALHDDWVRNAMTLAYISDELTTHHLDFLVYKTFYIILMPAIFLQYFCL